ncbi:MAG: DASS family sodium-coupled anion symporter [Bacteroidota bacterium]|nr:DASS family sodium-coupled anion symporter [Bacteroidota bacterium]MDP3146194.1 DASS family sodium-coupled anion symporter [Bacteroidota bacterium]
MRTNKKYFFQALGPLLALVFWFFIELDENNHQVSLMAGVAMWMVVWWFSEAVSLAVTALVPVLMLPVLGIADCKTVSQQYTDSIVFLFIGGFMLAFAIEKWHLHKRIALKILCIVGTKPSTILFGVMISTYLISNWISNTATTMMLFGAVFALVHETKEYIHKNSGKFAAALLLGLAFSATIGGLATPVGTPPNMYFFKAYKEAFPLANDLNFLRWSAIGYPISLVFLALTFFVLNVYFIRKKVELKIHDKFFQDSYNKLGKFSYEEKWVFGIFISCMLMWLTRADIDFGGFKYRGWNHIFIVPKYVDDAFVALLAALVLFLVPSKANRGQALLIWDDARKLRYDIILMFGSGFALAFGFEITGLSGWLAASLAVLKGVSPILIILGICVIVTIISEFASNIASIQLAIPVMIALQKDLEVAPLLLMMPATFAASLGFMLPVATAANTIVFGTKEINIKDMLRVGLILDLLGILLITFMCYLYLG